jgi:RNA recognition motif-containing protein
MNIYVSNLDQKVTNEQLTALFGQFGTVASAEVVTDVFTGQSRGFAYVEMPEEAEALAAISRLHQSELDNRQLSVEAAKPKETHKGSYPVGNSNFKSFGPIPKRGARNKKGSKRY